MKKSRTRKIYETIMEYLILTVATAFLVVGVYVFKFPNHFSFGGVTGIAVVLGELAPISPATINFIINMALLVLGFLFLGRDTGLKTVYVSLLTSVGLSLMEWLAPMEKPLTTEPVLELLFAIVLPAVSSAILFNIGGFVDCTCFLPCVRYTDRTVFLLWSDGEDACDRRRH